MRPCDRPRTRVSSSFGWASARSGRTGQCVSGMSWVPLALHLHRHFPGPRRVHRVPPILRFRSVNCDEFCRRKHKLSSCVWCDVSDIQAPQGTRGRDSSHTTWQPGLFARTPLAVGGLSCPWGHSPTFLHWGLLAQVTVAWGQRPLTFLRTRSVGQGDREPLAGEDVHKARHLLGAGAGAPPSRPPPGEPTREARPRRAAAGGTAPQPRRRGVPRGAADTAFPDRRGPAHAPPGGLLVPTGSTADRRCSEGLPCAPTGHQAAAMSLGGAGELAATTVTGHTSPCPTEVKAAQKSSTVHSRTLGWSTQVPLWGAEAGDRTSGPGVNGSDCGPLAREGETPGFGKRWFYFLTADAPFTFRSRFFPGLIS